MAINQTTILSTISCDGCNKKQEVKHTIQVNEEDHTLDFLIYRTAEIELGWVAITPNRVHYLILCPTCSKQNPRQKKKNYQNYSGKRLASVLREAQHILKHDWEREKPELQRMMERNPNVNDEYIQQKEVKIEQAMEVLFIEAMGYDPD